MSSACSHKYSTDYKQAFAFSALFSASCVSLQDKRMIVVKACLCLAVPDQKPHRLTNGEIHKTVMNYGAFLHRQKTDKVSRTLWGLPLTGYYTNLPKNTIYWYKVLHRALTAQGLQHTCPMINMLYEQIIAYKCFSLASWPSRPLRSRYNIDLDALIKITMLSFNWVLTESSTDKVLQDYSEKIRPKHLCCWAVWYDTSNINSLIYKPVWEGLCMCSIKRNRLRTPYVLNVKSTTWCVNSQRP